MSELNLIPGDASDIIYGNFILGQTFSPTWDHTLDYIDLDIRLSTHLTTPYIEVYEADINHHPIGDVITTSDYIVSPLPQTLFMRRARFKMKPCVVFMNEYYCILLKPSSPYFPLPSWWSYHQVPSTYARGIRIWSNDAGASWTDYLDEDFIFGEFGTPETPPSPPVPPIPLVMPTLLEQIPIADGFKIIYHTNVPCHLFMRWTLIPPVKHIVPVQKRGVVIGKDIRQCFVAYHDNEQLEAGDTLTHTFIKTGWPICQTRYFIFWGTNFEETVKSTSPIFTKHRVYTLLMELVYEEPWSEEGGGPPEMVLKYLEPWTYLTPPPPAFVLKFSEPWTS